MFGRLQRHFPTAPHWLANAASGTSWGLGEAA
jgi:hypothetical protein